MHQHSNDWGPRRRREKERTEKILEEIINENFLTWERKDSIQVQESQRVPNKMNPKGSTARHIIIKMEKIKDRENLKSSKEKQQVT